MDAKSKAEQSALIMSTEESKHDPKCIILQRGRGRWARVR